MNWTSLLVIIAVVAAVWLVRNAGQISRKDAQALLQSGALVIDVRSPGEFRAGDLATAVNIPIDQLEASLPTLVTDRNQALLLHCLSGTRSGMAKWKLRSLGYNRAFNLGSLARARKIVGD